MTSKCPGSGMQPSRSTQTGPHYPGGRIVVTRGLCPICGADVSINKPASRKPKLRAHRGRGQ